MHHIYKLVTLSFIVLLVSCKNIEDIHRNELSASIGLEVLPFSTPELGETDKSSNCNVSNNRVFSGSYEHRITNWLYAGLSASYYQRSYEVWEGNIYCGGHAMTPYWQIGNNKAYTISFLPTMKFNWVRKKYFVLYSRLSAGCRYHHENLTMQKHVDYLEDSILRKTSFRCQVSPLGLEVGFRQIRLFAEMGLGVVGLQSGIRIRY